MQKRIVVIGGGMAGTSAAHFLVKRGYGVTILEKNDYIGGRMRSEVVDNVALEYGAGFLMCMYTNVLAFLSERGLGDQLHRYSASPGIVRNGKIRALGFRTILVTSLLSWRAKVQGLRFLVRTIRRWNAIDIHRPWKLSKFDNASIADLYSTPSGKELFDYALQPALSATFYWTPKEVENTSEAILLVAGKSLLNGRYLKMREGLQRIPEAAAEGSTILLGRTVTRVQKKADGMYAVTAITNGVEQTLQADGVVCATTASVAAKIIPDLSATQRAFLENISYSSVAYSGRTYNESCLRGNKSIAIPYKEGPIVSGTVSIVGPKVDPTGPLNGSVKVSSAGVAGKRLCGESDDVILRTLDEAGRITYCTVFAGTPSPLSTRVWHWDETLPVFPVGYFKRLRRFLEEETAAGEAMVFAGDYIGGAFIEGAFTSGMQAAERLHAILKP